MRWARVVLQVLTLTRLQNRSQQAANPVVLLMRASPGREGGGRPHVAKLNKIRKGGSSYA